MNRGRGRRPPNERQYSPHGGRGRGRAGGPGQPPVQIYVPVGTKGSSSNNNELIHPGSQKSWNKTDGSLSNQGSDLSTSNCSYQQDCSLGGTKDISSDISKLKHVEDSQGTMVNRPPQLDCFHTSVSEPAKHARQATSHPKFKDRDRNSWKMPKAQPLQFDSPPASDNAAKQEDPFHAEGGTSSRFLEKVVQYEHTPDEKASKTDGSLSKQGSNLSPSICSYRQDCTSGGTEDISSDTRKLKLVEDSQGSMVNRQLNYSRDSVSEPAKNANQFKFKGSDQNSWTFLKPQALFSPGSNNAAKQDNPSHAEAGTTSRFLDKGVQYEQTPDEKAPNTGGSDNSDGQSIRVVFDLCPASNVSKTNLNAPLHKQNREKRNGIKRSIEGKSITELRSGMLLLKGYLSLDEQVEVVKRSRDFGLGPGGFYEPGYRDGGKLHLKMMCLGKNWDPETSKYGDVRPADGANPPLIPQDFLQLVKRAIQESHSFLKGRSKSCNVEYILPSLNPNICIVNFYSKSGRLGLHQDKDESSESLRRGLPVVSLSIGDSAEFLYGDTRDVERADNVTLKSGDVLIFGGKSRHLFHGVSIIVPDTAPKALMAETHMRPGRLNLTFREY